MIPRVLYPDARAPRTRFSAGSLAQSWVLVRNAKHCELLLAGLRLAAGETCQQMAPTILSHRRKAGAHGRIDPGVRREGNWGLADHVGLSQLAQGRAVLAQDPGEDLVGVLTRGRHRADAAGGAYSVVSLTFVSTAVRLSDEATRKNPLISVSSGERWTVST